MSFQQVEKNAQNIIKTILTNVIKMLTERELLKKEDLEMNITNITSKLNDENYYEIPLIKDYLGVLHDNVSNKIMKIKIIPHKITGIQKSFGANEFIESNKLNPKIIISKEINKKTTQQFIKNSKNTEIFIEHELMINIVDHEIVPKHILLSDDEAAEVLEKYLAKKKNMPKIYSGDPIARYYNMQPNNICRIIRPSNRCGAYATYRLVIKGNLN